MTRALLLLMAMSVAAQGQEMIRAGRFVSDVQGWAFYVNRDQARAEVKWEVRKPDGCALVRVERSPAFHNVQFWAAPLAIKKGQTYTVRFEARGEKATQLRVSLMRNAAPWRSLGLTANLALSPEWKTYTLLGKASEDSDDARLDFMPLSTIWLDNVSMQPSEPPQNAAVGSQVRLGPGWRGEPQAVADGKLNTAVGMRGHPDLPLVMELTLPAPTPVVAVNVEGVERGRHQKLGEMAIDVSADGQRWFFFGKPAREASSPKPGETLVRYAATNVVCMVKHVRVRALSVSNSAQVREVEVLRVAGETAAGPETLPPVPLFATACFRGWDYARLGYAASPSESIALRFSNQGLQPIGGEVRWRLADYPGTTLRSGSGK
ncbi:MAG: hypothetical protein FJ272_17265, partial [Planctomycetes bacterium]|nr:hypothetical protein [Planctomycetota bacterium]